LPRSTKCWKETLANLQQELGSSKLLPGGSKSRHHPANRLISCLVSDGPEVQPRLPPPFP
jgi:hypothetical protein